MVYDVLVIGGGTAGLKVAGACAARGKKTAVVDSKPLGGTCLHTGCIPTKALLYAAGIRNLDGLKGLGVSVKTTLNFSAYMKRVNDLVADGDRQIKDTLKKLPLVWIKGEAKFVSKNEVLVKGKRIKAKKIVVCTGTSNFVPPYEGLSDYYTSDNLLEMKKFPKKLVVVGGGYIATEFATLFALLGSKVTMIQRSERILKHLDEDVTDEIQKNLKSLGVDLRTGETVKNFSKGKVFLNSGKQVSYDDVIIALGRHANTKLDLESAGVYYDKKGIKVNSSMQTSNKNVFAIGDVNGNGEFAHVAKAEADVVIANLTTSSDKKHSYRVTPWAVFTHPECAGCGMSEMALKEKKISYDVYSASYNSVGRAHVEKKANGFIKVMVGSSGKILGAVCVGEHADILIHEYVVAMQAGISIKKLLGTVHIHPTYSEIAYSLKKR